MVTARMPHLPNDDPSKSTPSITQLSLRTTECEFFGLSMSRAKNPSWQMVGREELFERERHQEPVAGRHSCSLACSEAYKVVIPSPVIAF